MPFNISSTTINISGSETIQTLTTFLPSSVASYDVPGSTTSELYYVISTYNLVIENGASFTVDSILQFDSNVSQPFITESGTGSVVLTGNGSIPTSQTNSSVSGNRISELSVKTVPDNDDVFILAGSGTNAQISFVNLQSTIQGNITGTFPTQAGELITGTGSSTAVLSGGTSGQYLTIQGDNSVGWATFPNYLVDPTVATGDVLYRNSAGNVVALPIGTNGQVLTSNGSIVSWADGSTYQDPLTTLGDLLYHNGTDSARFPVGPSGQYLRSSSSGSIEWADLISSNGGLLTRVGGNDTTITIGTNGQVLKVVGGIRTWQDEVSGFLIDPTTTDGDILYRTGSNLTRLGLGSENQVLAVIGGAPSWVQSPLITGGSLTDNTVPVWNASTFLFDGSNISDDGTTISMGGSALSISSSSSTFANNATFSNGATFNNTITTGSLIIPSSISNDDGATLLGRDASNNLVTLSGFSNQDPRFTNAQATELVDLTSLYNLATIDGNPGVLFTGNVQISPTSFLGLNGAQLQNTTVIDGTLTTNGINTGIDIGGSSFLEIEAGSQITINQGTSTSPSKIGATFSYTAAALENGWTGSLSYGIDFSGQVHIKFSNLNPSAAANAIAFTLPSDFWPSDPRYYPVLELGGEISYVFINIIGQVRFPGALTSGEEVSASEVHYML